MMYDPDKHIGTLNSPTALATLAKAIQAAKAWAHRNCEECILEEVFGKHKDDRVDFHTCHGDLAVVKDVALAAVRCCSHEKGCPATWDDGELHPDTSGYCGTCAAEAEIVRQFSEGGTG